MHRNHLNEVYDLEDNEEVHCYECLRQGCRETYGKGQAFLAGPGHSPCDGNANYMCMEHLDDDAVMPSGKTAAEMREEAKKEQRNRRVKAA